MSTYEIIQRPEGFYIVRNDGSFVMEDGPHSTWIEAKNRSFELMREEES